MKVLGHVGGSVEIPCSQSFASTNTKYFCRNPCTDNKDILIKSDNSSSGRYRLEDKKNGVFTVTITDLQKSDTGTYWCGVDRAVKDTYKKVILTVTDASPTTAPVRTSRSEEPSTSSSTSTISNSTPPSISPSISKTITSIQSTVSPGGSPTTLLYTVAGLVSIVIILGLSLITLYCKCRRTTIKSQSKFPTTTTRNPIFMPSFCRV
uniref:Immunoglobulin domain-containing protein n=1 Tax=Astyanax mexicanus TaxID=7994 RepID=A0A3B1IYW2_ASTMX